MKDLTELERLLDITNYHFTKFTFEATVDTGFEQIAVEECIEKMGKNVAVGKSRGRIFFNSDFASYDKFNALRSVDHVNVVVGLKQFEFGTDKDEDLEDLRRSTCAYNWGKVLQLWQDSTSFDGAILPTACEYNLAAEHENSKKSPEDKGHRHVYIEEESSSNESQFSKGRFFKVTPIEEALDDVLSSDEESGLVIEGGLVRVPKFRVTCHRVGANHSFTSMDAARIFGGELHDSLHWLIDLTNYDLEVILQIQENDVYVAVSLNKKSKHHRNITHFGPTTLRATICYNMLRLCDPKPGDIVVDPLCGGGSIPIEGALEFPQSFFIGGDIHEKAITRTGMNVKDLPSRWGRSLKIDAVWWDATNLPFRNNSVDIFVTDLPFGKRSGSKSNNKVLYKKLLNELARTARLQTGKAVFLTYDKKCFNMAYGMTKSFWRQTRYLSINIGGLDAGCFVLLRTNEEFSLKLSKNERKKLARQEWLRKKLERQSLAERVSHIQRASMSYGLWFEG